MAWTRTKDIALGRSPSTTQLSATIDAGLTGDLCIAQVSLNGDDTVTSITDASGATWARAMGSTVGSYGGAIAEIWFTYALNANAHDIDINISTASPVAGRVQCFRGGLTSGGATATAQGGGTGSSTTTASANLVVAVESLVITQFAGGQALNYGAVTPPSGYTEAYENSDAGSWLVATECAYNLAVAAGTTTPTVVTASARTNRTIAVAAFALTAGGGGSAIAPIVFRRRSALRAVGPRLAVRRGRGGYTMNANGLLVPDSKILIAA